DSSEVFVSHRTVLFEFRVSFADTISLIALIIDPSMNVFVLFEMCQINDLFLRLVINLSIFSAMLADSDEWLAKRTQEIENREQPSPDISVDLNGIIIAINNIEMISDNRLKHLEEVLDRLNYVIQFNSRCFNQRVQYLYTAVKAGNFTLSEFGSTCNKLGSNRSDLDVSFKFNDIAPEMFKTDSAMHLSTIRLIYIALKKTDGFKRVISINTAKVPLVKCTVTVEGEDIDVDISCYNELGLINTQLLLRYYTWMEHELLADLGLFIKIWAKACDICDASKRSICTYGYIILLIHFLQRLQPQPLLPLLQEMGEKNAIIVDGWNVYFCDDAPQSNWPQCNPSVRELFLQFLEYYSNFDWENKSVMDNAEKYLLRATDIDESKKLFLADKYRLHIVMKRKIVDRGFRGRSRRNP
ncbi:hypothetical protein PMAYCL1PPCAC_14104, partial [Pristionchus mayeri]